MAASTTKWMQEGGFRLRCYGCDLRQITRTSPQAVAKRHVEKTGHTVEISRSMWKLVEPT